MERTTAVFWRRDRLDEAVRDLTTHGYGGERVRVQPARLPADRGKKRALFGLPNRLHFAGIGAASGMLIGLLLSGSPGGHTLTTMWLVIVGAVLGAIVGGMAGIGIGALRDRGRAEKERRGWLLEIDAADPVEAERLHRTLQAHGAEVLPNQGGPRRDPGRGLAASSTA